jgi:hypothetical protein
MRFKREVLYFLKTLRVAVSSPVNLVICAIITGLYFMVATAPKPSMIYSGDKSREALALTVILFMPSLGLYIPARLAIAFFGSRRDAYFYACALWALLMPVVVGAVANGRYGYRDDNAKHELVAKIFDLELKQLPSSNVQNAKLIDLGLSSCYPEYTGRQCWLVYVKPQSSDDLEIAQDVGNWHSIKSTTLSSLLPRWVKYGKVDVRRVTHGAYSVLGIDYQGR